MHNFLADLERWADGRFVDACRELLDQYDVRVNILGQRYLLPLDVQEAVKEIEDLTAGHSS